MAQMIVELRNKISKKVKIRNLFRSIWLNRSIKIKCWYTKSWLRLKDRKNCCKFRIRYLFKYIHRPEIKKQQKNLKFNLNQTIKTINSLKRKNSKMRIWNLQMNSNWLQLCQNHKSKKISKSNTLRKIRLETK